jgi:hypothetical protein
MDNYEELRARVEALEAQASNYPETPDSSTRPPVATDEELRVAWNVPGTNLDAFRAIYDLGVAHGLARSREVAKPANVTRDRDEAGNYLIIHDTPTPPPKPPSLKEQALQQLDTLNADLAMHGRGCYLSQIRRALEALGDD